MARATTPTAAAIFIRLASCCSRCSRGELPFRGNTRDVILQILNEEPPSPRKINPLISRDLETIVLRCLEKNPCAAVCNGA